MIGKFHLVSAGKRLSPDWTTDSPTGSTRTLPATTGPKAPTPTQTGYGKKEATSTPCENLRTESPPEFHQTTWASESAIDYIRQDHSGKPWLLNINIYDPHPPFIPPKEYEERFKAEDMPGPNFEESDLDHQKSLESDDFQRKARRPEDCDAKSAQAKYYAMIALIDDQLARILQALDETGQRENTVIIFTSDHGETLGDHGLMFKGCRFYEGLVKVPLIFSCPGKFQSNLQCDGLVELLDLSATLLDIAGLDIPEYHQGQTLVPILKGKESGDHIRESARCEYFDALDPHFTGGTGSFATMYRTERYKLVVYHDQNLGELYDLHEDPWEFNDLWNDPGQSELKSRLIFESFNQHVNLTTNVGSKRSRRCRVLSSLSST